MDILVSPLAFALLVLAAAVAGFVDSIAGGGGIITLPALLAAGLPPHLALGTNKLQSTFGSLTATLRFRAAGIVRLRDLLPGIAATAAGAALGAFAVGAIDAGFLKALIPVLLLAIVLFLALKPRFGLQEGRKRLPWTPFWIGAGLLLGFYDGFFGPGTGTLLIFLNVGVLGFDFLRASALAKAANWGSNVAALALFLSHGSWIPALALVLALGNLAGGLLGARLAIGRGAGWVRWVFVAVASALLLRLGWQVLGTGS